MLVLDHVWNFRAFWEAIWEGFWRIFDDFGRYFGVVGEFSGVIFRLGLVVCETLSRTNFFYTKLAGTNSLQNVSWDKSFGKRFLGQIV